MLREVIKGQAAAGWADGWSAAELAPALTVSDDQAAPQDTTETVSQKGKGIFGWNWGTG